VKFRAELELHGKTATGIEVPEKVVAALGAGKRIPVQVTINDFTYRSTVAVMGGRFLVPVAADVRRQAGVEAGDQIEVTLVADTQPRTVEVPADLAKAMKATPGAKQRYDGLSYTQRKEYVRAIESAKKPETRQRRIAKTIEALTAPA
jgi:Bacteriocin-protection, YdeI or OmpD-Associated/Domain of unknown function (DUF1905)